MANETFLVPQLKETWSNLEALTNKRLNDLTNNRDFYILSDKCSDVHKWTLDQEKYFDTKIELKDHLAIMNSRQKMNNIKKALDEKVAQVSFF